MWRIWVRRGGCIGSWWGNRREREQWGDLGVDGWIILGWIQEVEFGYMDWIGLAQDRDRWRMLVSAVMNFLVPWNAMNFLTSCKPVSFSRRTLHHGVSKYIGYMFRPVNRSSSGLHRNKSQVLFRYWDPGIFTIVNVGKKWYWIKCELYDVYLMFIGTCIIVIVEE